jgi:hypothetical protein
MGGRWSAVQRLAGRDAADPRLAVAPDRRVVLVWTTLAATGPGSTGAAWRSQGQPFADLTTMTRPAPGLMPGEAPQSDNGALFDARGRAYLWSSCDGVVRMAEPGSRRLALLQVAPRHVLGFTVSVTASGRGLASWVDSACATDPVAGSRPGPLRMRLLRDGAFGPATTLIGGLADPASFLAWGTSAIALAGDGSLFTAWRGSANGPVVIRVGADGTPGAVTPTTDGRVPQLADAGGNLLLTMPYAGVVVRPRTGADEPFDKGGPENTGMGASPAVVPHGRGFAVVWDPDLRTGADNRVVSPKRRLSVSFWRP